MINIAMLVYDISLTGGAEKISLAIGKELSKKYKVHLISIFNSKNFHSEKNYIFKVLSDKIVKIPFHIRSLSKRINRYCVDNEIDILISVTAGVNTIAYFGTRGIKTKIVYWEHSNLENKTYGKKHELRQLLGAKKFDKIFVLTNRDKDNFIRKYKLNPNKIEVLNNWISDEKTNCIYDKNSKTIVSVGRLEKVKGYDMLVKVAKKVFDKNPTWKWKIYGDGSYKETLINLIKENKLTNNIELMGNVTSDEKYNNCSFLVMTSYYEGFPLVILEAQAHHLPVISFNCPTGPDELIANNINGFVVDAFDLDLMAEKINELISDKEKRFSFSEKSDMYLNKYSKKDSIKKWYTIIDELIGGEVNEKKERNSR